MTITMFCRRALGGSICSWPIFLSCFSVAAVADNASRSCESNIKCFAFGMAGDCCPTETGIMLDCCAGEIYPTPVPTDTMQQKRHGQEITTTRAGTVTGAADNATGIVCRSFTSAPECQSHAKECAWNGRCKAQPSPAVKLFYKLLGAFMVIFLGYYAQHGTEPQDDVKIVSSVHGVHRPAAIAMADLQFYLNMGGSFPTAAPPSAPRDGEAGAAPLLNQPSNPDGEADAPKPLPPPAVMLSKGHTRAMNYYCGTIAFPLLMFKAVATTNIFSLNLWVIGGCTLGKIAVMLLTWVMAFYGYEPENLKGQRFLVASIFGFFATASNDFAIGLPVILALYGQRMVIYIAGNALVSAVLFTPISMVLFACGNAQLKADLKQEAIDNGEEVDEADTEEPALVWQVLKGLYNSWVINCTVVGVLYQYFLGHTVVDTPAGKDLPAPWGDFLALITSGFGVTSLFLAGVQVYHAKISAWSVYLSLMKVVVCAIIGYACVVKFVPDSDPDSSTFHDFALFYGAIPTSCAPLIFANMYAATTSEMVAAGILVGMFIAAPFMIMVALFLQREGTVETEQATLAAVQYVMNEASVICGFLCFFIFILARQSTWYFKNAVRMVFAGFIASKLAYEFLLVLANPDIRPEVCQRLIAGEASSVLFAISWLQNGSRIIFLVLQICAVTLEKRFPYGAIVGFIMVVASLALALIPANLVVPNTVNEICGRDAHDVHPQDLHNNRHWVGFLLVCSSLLALLDLVRPDSCLRRVRTHSNTRDAHADEEGHIHIVTPVVRLLVKVVILGYVLTCVNTTAVIHMQQNKGSFAQSLVLESFMEHSQLVFVLLAIFVDSNWKRMADASLAQVHLDMETWAIGLPTVDEERVSSMRASIAAGSYASGAGSYATGGQVRNRAAPTGPASYPLALGRPQLRSLGGSRTRGYTGISSHSGSPGDTREIDSFESRGAIPTGKSAEGAELTSKVLAGLPESFPPGWK